MKENIEQIPFTPTPFEDTLCEIAPGVDIPEYFWDFPYEIQERIVKDLKIEKDARMETEKILDHFDYLVKEWLQKFNSLDSNSIKN